MIKKRIYKENENTDNKNNENNDNTNYINIYDENLADFIQKINKIKIENNIRVNITDITKDDNFINYLINRRLNKCIKKYLYCESSLHIAAFMFKFDNTLHNKNSIIGENSFRCVNGSNKVTIHAEMDALNKLKIMIRLKKIKKAKMDLIVIRINKNGNLCESAPCFHCTQQLLNNDLVIIDKLYYSTIYGNIICIKFDDWVKYGKHHISKGWKWCDRANNQNCLNNISNMNLQ